MQQKHKSLQVLYYIYFVLLNALLPLSEAQELIYNFSFEGIQTKGPDCSSITSLHWLYISSKVSPWTIAVTKTETPRVRRHSLEVRTVSDLSHNRNSNQ